ncbi:MAG: protein phosphatase 2C domain-containing protein [Saprospiraceae bacterium]|nr:protein phosphatase 2C domain-containing protein [Saprospiraceae bacterium]
MTETKPVTWVVAYASAIGNAHIQLEIPCQDSCAHQKINEDWGIAVVSDGAGSAKHSHIGSDFVARNTLHCLEEVMKRNNWTPNALPTAEQWRTEALKALQLVMQRLMAFAEKNEYNRPDLGCTVLAAIYSPKAILAVHIGDGRAAYADGADWKALITPYRGDEVNETVFITSNIWTQEGVQEFIKTDIIEGNINGFALLTDGCEKGSFEVNIYDKENKKYFDPNRPYAKFFSPNVKGLQQLHKEGKSQDEINTLWKGFLTAGNPQFKHETDDKTMILGAIVEETA